MTSRARLVCRITVAAIGALVVSAGPGAQSKPTDPALDEVVRRMSAYAAGYGGSATIVLATETYTQQLDLDGRRVRPRTLVSEFAVVRASGAVEWAALRDVVKVDTTRVVDQPGRLVAVLTGPTGTEADVRRVIAEAAQRNLGGVATNFNVPTTALSFFRPQHVGRFTFTRAATRTIEGVETWALDFRETRSPTLVVTRDGDDVPMSGTVWVAPADGVVVRTRLRLRDFADVEPLADEYGRPTYWAREADYIQPQGAAEAGAATSTTVQGWTHAGPAPTASAAPPSKASARARRVSAARVINPEFREIDSLADIDVSYTREARSGMWLPAKMNEIYQGPLPRGRSGPIVGRIVGRATYAGYRHLDEPVRVTLPQ